MHQREKKNIFFQCNNIYSLDLYCTFVIGMLTLKLSFMHTGGKKNYLQLPWIRLWQTAPPTTTEQSFFQR